MTKPLDLKASGTLTRADVAAWLAELAESLGQGDELDVDFSGSTFAIDTPNEIELTVAVRSARSRTRLNVDLAW